MPFFSHKNEPVQQPAPQPAPAPASEPKRHGLFGGRHREVSPTPTNGTAYTQNTANYQGSPERDANGSIIGRRSLLQRSFGNGNNTSNIDMDPSIVQARERVMSAEAAEREADRALVAARESVRAAREQVRRLELEAQEEARRAKIKQYQAREVSKRARPLGRHDLYAQ